MHGDGPSNTLLSVLNSSFQLISRVVCYTFTVHFHSHPWIWSLWITVSLMQSQFHNPYSLAAPSSVSCSLILVLWLQLYFSSPGIRIHDPANIFGSLTPWCSFLSLLTNLNYLLKFITTLLHIPLISLTSNVIGTTSALFKPSLLLTSRQHSCRWVWLGKNIQVSLTGLTLRIWPLMHEDFSIA